MTTTTILSDNGVSSGSAGIKTTGGNDGTLQLQTTTAGGTATTAVTIDTSQNVGIGTSSPYGKFQVKVATNANAAFDSDGGTARLDFFNDAAAANVDGVVQFNNLLFKSNGSEKARIDSSGRFLIGTTSTILSGSNLLCASSSGYTAAFSTSGGASYHALGLVNTGTTGTRYYTQFYAGATPTNTGGISTSDGTTTVYATSSDYRLKENIQPMKNALATVSQLKPVTYTWKSTSQASQGFIAHELQSVIPESVVGEKDAVDENGNPVYQGIDTSFLVATLTAAIQEQQALITTLTERIAALEAK